MLGLVLGVSLGMLGYVFAGAIIGAVLFGAGVFVGFVISANLHDEKGRD